MLSQEADRLTHVIGTGEQFGPITSMSILQDCQRRSDIRPHQHRPVVSSVICAWMGSTDRSAWRGCQNGGATSPALVLSQSTIIRRHQSTTACSRKTSTRASKSISDMIGSSLEISFPLGPIEPATKRGFPCVVYSSANLRASRAAE